MYTPGVIRTSINNWKATKLQQKYQILNMIGEGTFGKVFKARQGNKYYAIKKLLQKSQKLGISSYTLKQIKILRELKHKNIIQFVEVCQGFDSKDKKKQIYIVLQLAQYDLKTLIQNKKQFNLPQRKCILKQILEGLNYLHLKNIVHRDIKNNNILYKNTGEVKIADFGCATWLSDNLQWSNIQNINYRAPQILFQFSYNQKIDMWSLGIVLSRLMFKQPLVKFKQLQQGAATKVILEELFKIFGTPTFQDWPQIYKIQDPNLKQLLSISYKRLLNQFNQQKLLDIDPLELDLLNKLLTLNPEKRISSKDALQHAYFKTAPLPVNLNEMPSFDFISNNCQIQIQVKTQVNKKMQIQQQQCLKRDRKAAEQDKRKNIQKKSEGLVIMKGKKRKNSKQLNQNSDMKKKVSSKEKIEMVLPKKEEYEDSVIKQFYQLENSPKNFNSEINKRYITQQNSKYQKNLYNELSIDNNLLSKEIQYKNMQLMSPCAAYFFANSPCKQDSFFNVFEKMNETYIPYLNQFNIDSNNYLITDKTSNYEMNQQIIQPTLKKKRKKQGQLI